MMLPDESTLAQALERVTGSGFEAWQSQERGAGHCAHPVRLAGRVSAIDKDTGEARVTFSTTGQPDGVLLKACGSRRATLCEACSALYKGDARQLVRAGLVGGKGTSMTVSTHPIVFATFTAPSFGAVHRAERPGEAQGLCHPGPANRCRHGNLTVCAAGHLCGDEAVGTPLCASCYDYEGAVVWNARCSELWRRTTIGVNRRLAAQLGLMVRHLHDHVTVSFVKVIEYQRRGVVHLHSVIRLDHPDGGCPDVEVSVLVGAVTLAAAKVSAPNPWRPEEPIRWGTQFDVRPVTLEAYRAVANYLAKYATKSTDQGGALDHRLKTGDTSALALPEHLSAMVETAWRLGGDERLAALRLREWAHTLGFRGHWLTKSRSWSTTFSALRGARHAYRLDQMRGPDATDPWGRPLESHSCEELGNWDYRGVGYSNAGDAWLATSARARAAENRRLAWEEQTWAE